MESKTASPLSSKLMTCDVRSLSKVTAPLLIETVAIQTITPPAVPECMADEIAQTQNPENALDQNFVPGASCSLAAQERF